MADQVTHGMGTTREEADRQLEAMLLLIEPWTPEQWQTARALHQHIIGQGMVCFGSALSGRWSYELWTITQMRQQQELEATMQAMQPMSLDEFKRELAG